MSVLCQILLIDNEKEFMDRLKQSGYPQPGAGWGRFMSEVPVIGTTLQIDWGDSDEFPGQGSDYFRVIYHHLHLIPKPNFRDKSIDAIDDKMQSGHHSVNCCMVYVVRI